MNRRGDSARLIVEALMQTFYGCHDHRERHGYRSCLCARQHGRDHRVPVGAFVIGWFIGRLRQRRREQIMSIEQLTYGRLLAQRSQLQTRWRQAILNMIPPGFWRWWDDRSTWRGPFKLLP